MKPLISVIIPTLNEENYIERTLLAAKNQDFKGKYEIIVSDSSSKDKTVKIAKKFADKVVTKKMGISAGRNEGAKASRGDLLLFLDADTMVLPNVLSEVAAYFEKHKNIIGLNIPILCDNLKKNIFYMLAVYGFDMLKEAKLQPVYAVCFACRRDYFFEAGCFPENVRVAEDIHFGEQLKKLGKLEFLQTTFAVTSSRRLEKWGAVKQLKAWPGGYFYFKYLKRQPAYPPIRN